MLVKTHRLLSLLSLILPLFLISATGCSDKSDAGLFVDDQADLLSSDQEERIVALNRQLLKDLDIHSLVVILDARFLFHEATDPLQPQEPVAFHENRAQIRLCLHRPEL